MGGVSRFTPPLSVHSPGRQGPRRAHARFTVPGVGRAQGARTASRQMALLIFFRRPLRCRTPAAHRGSGRPFHWPYPPRLDLDSRPRRLRGLRPGHLGIVGKARNQTRIRDGIRTAPGGQSQVMSQVMRPRPAACAPGRARMEHGDTDTRLAKQGHHQASDNT